MEHPELGICVFADVDLSPEEVAGDFAHERLAPREAARHRRSLVRASRRGVSRRRHAPPRMPVRFRRRPAPARRARASASMPPFTDYPHLKQAFTEGEIWRVAPSRLERARGARLLSTAEQADAHRARRRARFALRDARAQRRLQGLQPGRHQRDHRSDGPTQKGRPGLAVRTIRKNRHCAHFKRSSCTWAFMLVLRSSRFHLL